MSAPADRSPTAGPFDLTPPTPEQRAVLVERLSAGERPVLLSHGTEAPFCGGLLDNKNPGPYACRLCGLPLFRSGTKFESGTGWPSFPAPYENAHLKLGQDNSYGMVRVETLCARCGSHQGHVFPDGPPPTGMRFCINSVSLAFLPEGQPLARSVQDWVEEGAAF
ncbi:peptide-methionine (R)-S-oxide reductase MsrB [Azospirillum brasilense]|uniref:peptide-methionine (R)-S-oxide reductase MsrB n=1 Tax=Azospirillum brasilense TaxID=192 RepID=UPI00157ABBFD|nr:peptide-methionine (R)-S-oxide reductase MsrB [Azospirillum brasilense]NUB36351.1 peptide-methionine (R)-S-oxide reductase MsrB [Azospirillum brasilense]